MKTTNDSFRPNSYFRGGGKHQGSPKFQRVPPASPLGRVGEHLDPLDDDEVEIVMIGLRSVLGDVISIRARQVGSRIEYSVVDEYQQNFLFSPTTSSLPLTLGEVKKLLWSIKYNPNNALFADNPNHRPDAPFFDLRSDFYPGLNTWLMGKLG